MIDEHITIIVVDESCDENPTNAMVEEGDWESALASADENG